MANTIQIRRGTTCSSTLAEGELGYNLSKNILYIGNNGNKAIGGSGAFLPLSGGTMTGTLTAPYIKIYSASWPSLSFGPDANTGTGSIYQAISSHRIGINQFAAGSDYSENYLLPTPSVLEEDNAWYNILTSKLAVTVAQGGTGATTAADARKNLAVPYYAKYDAGNLQTGAGNVSAWITYYDDNGTTYNQMDLGKTNTSFYKPVDIASGGTGATTATAARTALGITPANIGALPTTVQTSGYSATSGSNSTSAYFIYKQGTTNLNKMDLWADHTSFMKPVDIASGGTGATNIKGAATNLFANNTNIKEVFRLAGSIQTVKQLFSDVTTDISVSDYFTKLNNLSILNTMLSFTHNDGEIGLAELPETAGMGIALNGWSGYYPYHKMLFFGNTKLYYWSPKNSAYEGQWYTVLDDTTGVKKSGDTMTGCLWANGGFAVKGNHTINILSDQAQGYYLKNYEGNTIVGGMKIDPTTNQVSFSQKMVNQNAYEVYYLPAPASLTSGKNYTILTTKNAGNGLNSYLTEGGGISETVDVFTLTPGVYHLENTSSTDKNYPIAESRATVFVYGQFRAGTAATDGYPNGYWVVRVLYGSGKEYINYRYWSAWKGWQQVHNGFNAVPIDKGGTGATNASGALTNLGALPLAGGTMTGTITLHSTGFKTSNSGGYYTNQYGNFIHQVATANQTWNICNNAGASKFAIDYETGNIAAKGAITGTATSQSWILTTRAGAFKTEAAANSPAASAALSMKVNGGAWAIANLSTTSSLYFVFGSDTNYSASTNKTTQIIFENTGKINANVYGGNGIRYSTSQPSDGVAGQIWLKPI